MPAPRKKTSDGRDAVPRWTLPSGPGSITPRRGRCRLRLGDIDVVLPLDFIPANKPRALAILRQEQEAWREREMLRRLGYEEPEKPDTRWLSDVIEEFRQEHFRGLHPGTTEVYEQSIKLFFPVHLPDLPMDPDAIRERIRERRAEAEVSYAPGTLSERLRCIRTILRYAVDCEYLPRDPMTRMKLPAKSSRRTETGDVPMFRPEEAAAMVAWLKGEEQSGAALTVDFLFRTLLRAQKEALPLEWGWISERSIEVRVAKGDRPRSIPIDPIPGLRGTIRGLHELTGRSRLVLPYRSLPGIRGALERAIAGAGITPTGHSPHDLRRGGIWWMEHELGWDRQLIADIAGQTLAVQSKHYRRQPSAEDLEERIAARSRPVR